MNLSPEKTRPRLGLFSPALGAVLIAGLLAAGCSLGFMDGIYSRRSAKEPLVIAAPPGEKEFLEGRIRTASPLLARAAAEGSLRAIFFMHIIYKHGLDGGPLRPEPAKKTLEYLALRYAVLELLLAQAPETDRPLYQTALAWLSFLGLNPEKKPNLSRARELASEAAGTGFGPAVNLMTALALTADDDIPLPDWQIGPEAAFTLAQSGAEKKDALAMGNLSALYRQGIGTPANLYLASTWAHAAAVTESPPARAQNDLGFYYEQGLPVTADPAEAARWYGLAAARGYQLAQANLERLKNKGSGPALASGDIDY
jgi:TPR repeat protein